MTSSFHPSSSSSSTVSPATLALPWVVLHNAVSVDGRVDHFAPDVELFHDLAARFREDATLAGSDTILGSPEALPDDEHASPVPQAGRSDRRPLLVTPDSRGRVRSWRRLLSSGVWRGGVALVTTRTPPLYLELMKKIGVEVMVHGDERVDLRGALGALRARHGVSVVRVDSGGTLNGALLRAGLVDEVSVIVHPTLVGGTSSRAMFRAPDLERDDDVQFLRLRSVDRAGGGAVWLRYEVVRRG
jgi:2,5-diamino-6-(ribosylamino)-4(3H)-pyrimidinone 5'-phosphate reductase